MPLRTELGGSSISSTSDLNLLNPNIPMIQTQSQSFTRSINAHCGPEPSVEPSLCPNPSDIQSESEEYLISKPSYVVNRTSLESRGSESGQCSNTGVAYGGSVGIRGTASGNLNQAQYCSNKFRNANRKSSTSRKAKLQQYHQQHVNNLNGQQPMHRNNSSLASGTGYQESITNHNYDNNIVTISHPNHSQKSLHRKGKYNYVDVSGVRDSSNSNDNYDNKLESTLSFSNSNQNVKYDADSTNFNSCNNDQSHSDNVTSYNAQNQLALSQTAKNYPAGSLAPSSRSNYDSSRPRHPQHGTTRKGGRSSAGITGNGMGTYNLKRSRTRNMSSSKLSQQQWLDPPVQSRSEYDNNDQTNESLLNNKQSGHEWNKLNLNKSNLNITINAENDSSEEDLVIEAIHNRNCNNNNMGTSQNHRQKSNIALTQQYIQTKVPGTRHEDSLAKFLIEDDDSDDATESDVIITGHKSVSVTKDPESHDCDVNKILSMSTVKHKPNLDYQKIQSHHDNGKFSNTQTTTASQSQNNLSQNNTNLINSIKQKYGGGQTGSDHNTNPNSINQNTQKPQSIPSIKDSKESTQSQSEKDPDILLEATNQAKKIASCNTDQNNDITAAAANLNPSTSGLNKMMLSMMMSNFTVDNLNEMPSMNDINQNFKTCKMSKQKINKSNSNSSTTISGSSVASNSNSSSGLSCSSTSNTTNQLSNSSVTNHDGLQLQATSSNLFNEVMMSKFPSQIEEENQMKADSESESVSISSNQNRNNKFTEQAFQSPTNRNDIQVQEDFLKLNPESLKLNNVISQTHCQTLSADQEQSCRVSTATMSLSMGGLHSRLNTADSLFSETKKNSDSDASFTGPNPPSVPSAAWNSWTVTQTSQTNRNVINSNNKGVGSQYKTLIQNNQISKVQVGPQALNTTQNQISNLNVISGVNATMNSMIESDNQCEIQGNNILSEAAAITTNSNFVKENSNYKLNSSTTAKVNSDSGVQNKLVPGTAPIQIGNKVSNRVSSHNRNVNISSDCNVLDSKSTIPVSESVNLKNDRSSQNQLNQCHMSHSHSCLQNGSQHLNFTRDSHTAGPFSQARGTTDVMSGASKDHVAPGSASLNGISTVHSNNVQMTCQVSVTVPGPTATNKSDVPAVSLASADEQNSENQQSQIQKKQDRVAMIEAASRALREQRYWGLVGPNSDWNKPARPESRKGSRNKGLDGKQRGTITPGLNHDDDQQIVGPITIPQVPSDSCETGASNELKCGANLTECNNINHSNINNKGGLGNTVMTTVSQGPPGSGLVSGPKSGPPGPGPGPPNQQKVNQLRRPPSRKKDPSASAAQGLGGNDFSRTHHVGTKTVVTGNLVGPGPHVPIQQRPPSRHKEPPKALHLNSDASGEIFEDCDYDYEQITVEETIELQHCSENTDKQSLQLSAQNDLNQCHTIGSASNLNQISNNLSLIKDSAFSQQFQQHNQSCHNLGPIQTTLRRSDSARPYTMNKNKLKRSGSANRLAAGSNKSKLLDPTIIVSTQSTSNFKSQTGKADPPASA